MADEPRSSRDPGAPTPLTYVGFGLGTASLLITATGGGTRGTIALVLLALAALALGAMLVRRPR